ncbi:hypothetical protein [Arthrobacter sp. NamB2]|uniref:hypothetical protein n=1 Tax=Arthrobacter sp. NamB2 TaxID=2576035 RepID=UPI0016796BCB|nr:hypothetical protein [Arthrobacter sp. NamB2]
MIPDLFETGGLEGVSFIDDQQFGAPARAGFGMGVRVDSAVLGVVDREGNLLAGIRGSLSDNGGDDGGEEGRACFEDSGRDGAAQQGSPMAMPLEEYLDEVIGLLKIQPDADEILVERVKWQRNAEAEGRYQDVLGVLSALFRD